jgi:hypothetical protein
MNYISKLKMFLVPACILGLGLLFWSNPASAQSSSQSVRLGQDPAANGYTDRESLHLNTIGTYSAGFVLQSFGYIGILADVLSRGVYEPEMVTSMLGETITFLKNANQQLVMYKTQEIQISDADKKFIQGISDIIGDLTAEAEALSSFAQTFDKADLAKFESARTDAWAGIKKTLGVN